MKRLASGLLFCAMALHAAVETPEQYFGFRIGSDRKLVRWDKIVGYMQKVAKETDRVRFRNLGPTTNNNPFIMLEISSADNLKNLDRMKALERKLYFQGGAPTDAERDEIFRSGKAVVLITNNIHSTEIGASQMAIELVHRLATEDSPMIRKILDNVVFLLVPSLNPDGQILVTDWYNKVVGTPFEATPLPELYHAYTGHDNNRDMYLFSQRESRMAAQVLWHEWFPAIWLDEHQQGSAGPSSSPSGRTRSVDMAGLASTRPTVSISQPGPSSSHVSHSSSSVACAIRNRAAITDFTVDPTA